MKFYGKVVDKVFGLVLVALFSALLLLAGSLYINVNDQIRQDEAALKAGTQLQRRTMYVFDRGAVWGYQLAQKQLIPAIRQLVQDAIKIHDQKFHSQHKHPHKIK